MADLFIISAPSGAGKTTLVSALLKSCHNLTHSISHTTRQKRPKEQDGIDYHFVSPPQFEQLIKQKAMLEYANVFDHYYGTHKQNIETTLNNNKDVIMEIDWQGYRQIKEHFKKAIAIFILPPSLDVLEKRLTKRGQDDPATINNRMVAAQNEIQHYQEYDFLIINHNFQTALSELKSIVLNNHISSNLSLANQSVRHQSTLNKLLEKI